MHYILLYTILLVIIHVVLIYDISLYLYVRDFLMSIESALFSDFFNVFPEILGEKKRKNKHLTNSIFFDSQTEFLQTSEINTDRFTY